MGNDDSLVFDGIAHLKIIDSSYPQQVLSIMKWIMEGNRGLVYLRILRAPSGVLSGLALTLLLDLVSRLARSRAAGVFAIALYATAPETIVRASYAGYFAPAVFWMLVAAGLFAPQREASRRSGVAWLAAAGVILAWTDHKTVAFVLGTTALFAWRAWRDAARIALSALWRAVDLRAVALGAGFSIATFAWWGYGLAVDRHAFVEDHLRKHVIHRALLDDVRLGASEVRYAPGIGVLWKELSDHTGWLLLPIGFLGAASWFGRRDGDDSGAVLAAWLVAIAVVFSITDWRQTKHLMNALAPAVRLALLGARLVPGGRIPRVSISDLGLGGHRSYRSWARPSDGRAPGIPSLRLCS